MWTALAHYKNANQVRVVFGSILACEAGSAGSTPAHLTNFTLVTGSDIAQINTVLDGTR